MALNRPPVTLSAILAVEPLIPAQAGIQLSVIALGPRFRGDERRDPERLPMNVFDAVASRFSCRAFLPTPVPEADRARHSRARGARAVRRQCAAVARACAGRGKTRTAQGAGARAARAAAARRGRRIRHLPARSERAVRDAPPPGRRRALSVDRRDARGPRRPLSPIRAQFRVLRRAGRAVAVDRPQHGSAAMVGPRRLHPDGDAAGARVRAAQLRPGSLDPLAQDRLFPPRHSPRLHICSAAWRSATPTRTRRSTTGAPRASRSTLLRRLQGFEG